MINTLATTVMTFLYHFCKPSVLLFAAAIALGVLLRSTGISLSKALVPENMISLNILIVPQIGVPGILFIFRQALVGLFNDMFFEGALAEAPLPDVLDWFVGMKGAGAGQRLSYSAYEWGSAPRRLFVWFLVNCVCWVIFMLVYSKRMKAEERARYIFGSAGWTIEIFLICCCISDLVPYMFKGLDYLIDASFLLALLLSIPASILEALDVVIRTVLYIGMVSPLAGVLFIIIICGGSVLTGTVVGPLVDPPNPSEEGMETGTDKTQWYEKIPRFIFLEADGTRYERVYTGIEPDPRLGLSQLEYEAENNPRDRIIIKKQYIAGAWADSSKGRVYWQP